MCDSCVDLIQAILTCGDERLPRTWRESWAREHLPNTLTLLREGQTTSYPLLAILRRADREGKL